MVLMSKTDSKVSMTIYTTMVRNNLNMPISRKTLIELYHSITEDDDIDKETFYEILSCFNNIDKSLVDYEHLFHIIDEDDSGTVDMQEFLQLFQFITLIYILKTKPEFTTLDIFQVVDQDSDGCISRKEYKEFFSLIQSLNVNQTMCLHELNELFDVIDSDGSGQIDSKEWIIGSYEHDICKNLTILTTGLVRIHIGTQEFEILMRNKGVDIFSARSMFQQANVSMSGYISKAEAKQFCQICRNQDYSLESTRLSVQISTGFYVLFSFWWIFVNYENMNIVEIFRDVSFAISGVSSIIFFIGISSDKIAEVKNTEQAMKAFKKIYDFSDPHERSFMHRITTLYSPSEISEFESESESEES